MHTYREYGAQSFRDNPATLSFARHFMNHHCLAPDYVSMPNRKPYWGALYSDGEGNAHIVDSYPTLESAVADMRRRAHAFSYDGKTGYDFYIDLVRMTSHSEVDRRCNYYKFHFKNND